MKKQFLISLLSSISIAYSTAAQIKWDVANDTITLSPNVISTSGSISISKGNNGGTITTSGSIGIALKEKNIYFDDGNNLFKISSDALESLTLKNYGVFTEGELFNDDFKDSVLQHYRRLIYPTLNFNEVSFSSSKRVEYSLEESGLTLKNQRLTIGKLCYIDLNSIIILTEDGQLVTMQDGDFNFLKVGGFKGFYCKSLYNFIFNSYQKKLAENIETWVNTVKQMDIEGLISIYGPFDKMINISTDKKMISWKKNIQAYYLDISTYSNSSSVIKNNYSANISTLGTSYYNNVSPLFLYGNSYRSTYTSIVGSSLKSSSVFTNQSGKITSKEEGFTIAIIQDSNNKIVQVYHENIFSEPQYGSPFRFITF